MSADVERDAGIVWCDPPPRTTHRRPHRDVAAALRQHPGRWGLLPFYNPGLVNQIRDGAIRAYLPPGAFDATSRDGQIWAQYLPGGGPR